MGCTWVANLTCSMVPLLMITDMIHPWSASNKNRRPTQNGGSILYKLLPIPCIIQSENDKKDRGDQHIHPAMEDRVEKYLRVLVNGDIVRIQEDVPLAFPDSSLYHGE